MIVIDTYIIVEAGRDAVAKSVTLNATGYGFPSRGYEIYFLIYISISSLWCRKLRR